MGPFTFHAVVSDAELRCALALRDAVYRRRLGLALSDTPDDAERDRLGYVFLLRHDSRPVGTARVIPTTCASTELAQLGALPAWAAQDPCCGEVGRLATLRSAGVDPMATSPILISCCARWLLRHTPMRRYVAYSRLVLLPVWRHLGALDTGVRFVIAERAGTEYGLITGHLHDAVSLAGGVGRHAPGRAAGVA